ncbi:hypothetical protein QF023_000386 [Chryseobacterium sp. SLBN-27]|nr:hypothetical protein [Chryseobacterium sp. SLBN-27]
MYSAFKTELQNQSFSSCSSLFNYYTIHAYKISTRRIKERNFIKVWYLNEGADQ